VYNSKNMPPYALPLGAYTAGFKSCSQMGNPMVNYNHILLQDDMARECLWLHAENRMINEQENDMEVKQPRTVVRFHGS
jgi:type VI secretion system secreted protein VgrG